MSFFYFSPLRSSFQSFVAFIVLLFLKTISLAEIIVEYDEVNRHYHVNGDIDEIISEGLPVAVFTVEKRVGSPRLGRKDEFYGIVGFGDNWDDLTFRLEKDAFQELRTSGDEDLTYVLVWVDAGAESHVGESVNSRIKSSGYCQKFIGNTHKRLIPVILALDPVDHQIIALNSEFEARNLVVQSILNDDAESLAQAHFDAGNEDAFGYSLLHWAASYGAEKCMSFLLESGADPNVKSFDDVTPLHLSGVVGNWECAELLLAGGAKINAKEKFQNRTALFYAAKHGHLKMFDVLLNRKARWKFSVGATNDPLYASLNGYHHEIVYKLLDRGAKLRSLPENRKEFLLNLVSEDAVELVKLFLGKKKDINKLIRGTSPVIVAAMEGSNEMVDLLLAEGIDLNIQDSRGRTPLIVSVIFNRPDMFLHLIDKGADLDIKTNQGTSALALAVLLKRNDMVDLLIDKGANLNNTSKGETPLIYQATLSNNRVALNKLINAGAPCGIDEEHSAELLDYAFRYDIQEVVDFAFSQCVEKDFLFYGHFSPRWVADYYDAEAIKTLLSEKQFPEAHDFDPEIERGKGLTRQVKPVSIQKPPYPLDLQDLFGEFVVRTQIVIDKDGSVLFPKIIENPVPQMDKLILESLLQWKFNPIVLDSKPVRTTFQLPLKFVPVPEEKRIYDKDTVDVMPIAKKRTLPQFPTAFLATSPKGRVDLIIVIDEEGKVTVEGVKNYTHAVAANACVEAARKWEFTPGYLKGVPVKARFVQPIPYDYQ